MSFFSRSSSNDPHYRNSQHGSKHYQRKGIFGDLNTIFGSRPSREHYEKADYYPTHPNTPMNNQTIGCPKCRAELQIGAKFCSMCGEKIPEALFCTACGEKLSPDAKFCSACGTKING